MNARLKQLETPERPLFKIERREGLRGAWYVHDIGPRPDWPLSPEPGNAVRITRADRAKPVPAKLAHSIAPSRATGKPANHSVADKAKLMAAHIRRTGQTEIHVYYLGHEAWPSGVPSSAREFSNALVHELREEYTTPEGWKRLCLPERYRFVYVDPSKDVETHDDPA